MRAWPGFGYAPGLARRQSVPSLCLLPIELKLYFLAPPVNCWRILGCPRLAHNNLGDGYVQQFDDEAHEGIPQRWPAKRYGSRRNPGPGLRLISLSICLKIR